MSTQAVSSDGLQAFGRVYDYLVDLAPKIDARQQRLVALGLTVDDVRPFGSWDRFERALDQGAFNG